MTGEFGRLSNLGGTTFTVSADISQFKHELDLAKLTAEKTSKAIGTELSQASAVGTRGLLQAAYALDDLQYGFRAIVNNIPQALMFLGPGVAGAAGIAAVAISQLVNHWGEMSAALQAAWEGGSAERIKALADRAEEAAKAFDKMASAATKSQAAIAGGIAEAFTEGGPKTIHKALTDTLMAAGQGAEKRDLFVGGKGFLPGAQAAAHFLAEKMAGHRIPRNAKEQAEIQYEETAKKARDLIGATNSSDPEVARKAREDLQHFIKMNPGAFPEAFAQAIGGQPPGQAAKDFAGERGGEAAMEAARKKALDQVNKDIQLKKDIDLRARQDAKNKRIQDLEDQRDAIHRRQQDLSDMMQEQRHRLIPNVGSGLGALQDFLLKTPSGMSEAEKFAKAQRDATNKKLDAINESIKKEHRAPILNR